MPPCQHLERARVRETLCSTRGEQSSSAPTRTRYRHNREDDGDVASTMVISYRMIARSVTQRISANHRRQNCLETTTKELVYQSAEKGTDHIII